MQIIRHGDVLLRPRAVDGHGGIKAFESSNRYIRVPADGDRAVLAYGERSGHSHSLPYGGAYLYRDSEGGPDVLVVDVPSKLQHLVGGQPTGEHADADVPRGEYDVIRQRGLSPDQVPDAIRD